MYLDAIDLKEFYDTALGGTVKRVLRKQMRGIWPDVKGKRILAIGFPMPFLSPFLSEAERVCVVLPSEQGALHWPKGENNLTLIADEGELPFADNSFDLVLVMHCFEFTAHLHQTIREIWRVLTDEGRVMVCATNRSGLWARRDITPFGHGRPFSMGQLKKIMRDHMFTPEIQQRSIYVPPIDSRVILASAPTWEHIGQKFCGKIGAVNIIEAGKQLYAGTPIEASVSAVARRRNAALATQEKS